MSHEKGLLSNYVTLKLSFFDPPTHPPPSHFITNDHKTAITLPHAWHRYPPSSFDYHFWSWKKPQRYATTQDRFTHAVKQLNQIVRFLKKNKSWVRISVFNELPSRGVLWSIASRFRALGINLSLSSDNFLKLFLIFFLIGEDFDTATHPFWGINLFL